MNRASGARHVSFMQIHGSRGSNDKQVAVGEHGLPFRNWLGCKKDRFNPA